MYFVQVTLTNRLCHKLLDTFSQGAVNDQIWIGPTGVADALVAE
jgi:hypothetical protein